MKKLAQEASDSLESLKSQVAPPSSSAQLANPLSPAEFNKQMGVLVALGLENGTSPYLVAGTDTVSHLLKQEHWGMAMEAVYAYGGEGGDCRGYRLKATIMSGWEAFVKLALGNQWGVTRECDGPYSHGSCLDKLDNLATEAIQKGWLRLEVSTWTNFLSLV